MISARRQAQLRALAVRARPRERTLPRVPWWLAPASSALAHGQMVLEWVSREAGPRARDAARQFTPADVDATLLVSVADVKAASGAFPLLLRTFGGDGYASVLDEDGQVLLMETLLAEACEACGLGPPVGLIDADAVEVPVVIDFLRALDDWFGVVEAMVHRASVVIVSTGERGGLGHSLRQELEAIRRSGSARRVVLVCPPDDSPRQRTAQQDALRLLGWPAEPTQLLVACLAPDDALCIQPFVGPGEPGLARAYRTALVTALRIAASE